MNKSASLPSIPSSSGSNLRKPSMSSQHSGSSSSSRKSITRSSNPTTMKNKEKKLEFASSEYFDDDDFDPVEGDLMISVDIDDTKGKGERNIKKSHSKKSLLSPISTPGKTLQSNSTVNRQRKGAIMSVALQQAMTHVKDFMTDVQKAIVLLREGKMAMDSSDFRGAIDVFSECISLNPSISVFSCRATCYKMLDMYSEAYFDYCYMIRLQPEDGSIYSSRGLCLAKLKKLSMAFDDFDVAIEMEPNNPNHYFSRSNVWADMGKHQAAVEDLTRSFYELDHLAAAGVSSTANTELRLKCSFRRAVSYFELKQFDKAVLDLTDLLNADPNSIQGRALMGRSLKVLCEFKKAEEQLSVAIVLDDTLAILYTERGDLRFRTGLKNKLIEAIYDFDKAIRLIEAKLPNASMHNYSLTSGRSMNSNPASFYRELEEQVSDAYFKRAQTKLMLDSSSSSSHNHNHHHTFSSESNYAQYRSALSDALKAAHYTPDDDDYQMLVAICYIKLNEYDNAKGILEEILAKSPNNFKALFNISFCQRALGDQRQAIEVLTKILAFSEKEGDSLLKAHNNTQNGFAASRAIAASLVSLGSPVTPAAGSVTPTSTLPHGLGPTGGHSSDSFPMHKVYEMRGTMLHEMQAHKLALFDLGKAIAINPSRADNFVLRGDCHSRMGNYEQAIVDLIAAEDRGYVDMCSLLLNRGTIYRMLGRSNNAADDFSRALTLVEKDDKVTQIRVRSFLAFCCIDRFQYEDARKLLIEAKETNSALIDMKTIQARRSTFSRNKNRDGYASMRKLAAIKVFSDEKGPDDPHTKRVQQLFKQHLKVEEDENEDDDDREVDLTATYEEYTTRKAEPTSEVENELLYLKRVDFILVYHIALTIYMQKRFTEAHEILSHCLSDEMRRFIPDDLTLGALQYFAALTCVALPQPDYDMALYLMDHCSTTHWVDLLRNKFLYYFTLAKIHQSHDKKQNHKEAVRIFSLAIEINPENPHCYFRRAWSQKGLSDFKAAGEDFETAKQICPHDPNFSLDYRRISNYQYMVIDTEPDLNERFPPLLPLPGMFDK